LLRLTTAPNAIVERNPSPKAMPVILTTD